MSDLPTQPGATPSGAPEFKSAPVTETPMTLIGKIEKKFPKVGSKLKDIGERFTTIDDRFQTGLGLAEIGIGRSMIMAKKETEKNMGPFDVEDKAKEVTTTALELTDDGYKRIFNHSSKYFEIFINQAVSSNDGGLLADLLMRNVFTVDELVSLAHKYNNAEAIDFLQYI